METGIIALANPIHSALGAATLCKRARKEDPSDSTLTRGYDNASAAGATGAPFFHSLPPFTLDYTPHFAHL